MKKELFKTIISDIKADSFFSEYKYIKSERTLFWHNGGDAFSLILEHWRDYEEETCVIRPIYGRHFDILYKWFEKYSFLPLKNQRILPQIMLDNNFFGQEQEISFKYDFSDYNEKIQHLINSAKDNLTIIAEKYTTLNDYYTKIVKPQIIGDEDLPEAGAEWIFIYLTLGFLVDEAFYPTLKNRVIKHAEWLLHHHELNVAEYYDKLDEIIAYMENNATR